MITFLISLSVVGLLIIIGIIWYQKKNIRKNTSDHTDDMGSLIDRGENPLSVENIADSHGRVHEIVHAEIMLLVMTLLRTLIMTKRWVRKTFDRGIRKLAQIAFPEEKLTGPLDENTILSHVEEHKKTVERGSIE